MSWQTIELNMIPGTKELPVVYASQFDSDRTISFQMLIGEDEWTIPKGLTIELHCRKVDDNIVMLAPSSVEGSVITFVTTEQLTACSGDNKCELSFIDENDLVIGSLNFILKVEADPIAGGLTSETAIYDLTQQIEDIAQEVIGEDYYDKTEVDALLEDKADVSDLPDMTQYYTKTQTDTLLNGKADASTTYTKTEVDNALALKVDSSDLATVATTGDYDDLINKPVLPDMTQYYTKSEVDAIVDNIFPTFIASGAIASFITALNKPLVSVTHEAGATTITRCGVNFLNNADIVIWKVYGNSIFSVDNSDNFIVETQDSIAEGSETQFISLPAGTYTLAIDNAQRIQVAWGGVKNVDVFNTTNVQFTLSEYRNDIHFKIICSSYPTNVGKIRITLGSTPSAYEAYNGQTVPVADATSLTTLSGVNNVFADSGDVTVQYKYMSM